MSDLSDLLSYLTTFLCYIGYAAPNGWMAANKESKRMCKKEIFAHLVY